MAQERGGDCKSADVGKLEDPVCTKKMGVKIIFFLKFQSYLVGELKLVHSYLWSNRKCDAGLRLVGEKGITKGCGQSLANEPGETIFKRVVQCC